MKKSTKIIGTAVALTLIVGAVIGGRYLYSIKQYKDMVNDIKIESVDLSKLKDGKYYGGCDVNVISAKVEVTVKNAKIENIKLLEHKNERGIKAEAITASVLSRQNLDVDTISGATNSSKVILKAIQNALDQK